MIGCHHNIANAFLLFLSPTQEPHDQGEADTDNDAGGNGKVEAKVFLLNGDIAGESSQKGDLSSQHQQPAYDNHKDTKTYENLAECAQFTHNVYLPFLNVHNLILKPYIVCEAYR